MRTFQNDRSVDNVAVFLNPVASDDKNWVGYTMVFDRAELNRNEPDAAQPPVRRDAPG